MRDWQDDEAPTFRFLSNRTHTSSRDRLCDTCDEPIGRGERYRSICLTEDGVFKALAEHASGCPKFARILAGEE